jgi:hypothetical protein
MSKIKIVCGKCTKAFDEHHSKIRGAVLLLGFAGAMRRSELVGLDVNDLKETKVGLCLYIRTSKTDQERQGQIVAIAPGDIACPVKTLKAWLAAAKITSGPILGRYSTAVIYLPTGYPTGPSLKLSKPMPNVLASTQLPLALIASGPDF